jgi:hypothetical protein
MLTTPETFTVTLTASQIKPQDVPHAKWLRVISCTTPTVRIGFGGDRPQTFYPGFNYSGPKSGFDRIHVEDASGAGCTVVVTVSEDPIQGQGETPLNGVQATLTAMDGRLTTIDADTSNINTRLASAGVPNIIDETVYGDVNRHLLFAANPNREALCVGPLAANTGIVYVGDVALATNHYMWRFASDGFWYPQRGVPKGAIYVLTAVITDGIFAYEY